MPQLKMAFQHETSVFACETHVQTVSSCTLSCTRNRNPASLPVSSESRAARHQMRTTQPSPTSSAKLQGIDVLAFRFGPAAKLGKGGEEPSLGKPLTLHFGLAWFGCLSKIFPIACGVVQQLVEQLLTYAGGVGVGARRSSPWLALVAGSPPRA